MSDWVVIKLEHQVGRWVWFAVSITAESSVRKSNSSRVATRAPVVFAWKEWSPSRGIAGLLRGIRKQRAAGSRAVA